MSVKAQEEDAEKTVKRIEKRGPTLAMAVISF
jgi:hypothetical protein